MSQDPRSVADQLPSAEVARLAFAALSGGEPYSAAVIRTEPTERFRFPYGIGPRALCQGLADHEWNGRLVKGGLGYAECDRCRARIRVKL